MLATLIIGLREGLEAALIVGIIAAFLRKNGKSLVPMWCGVIFATLLSIAVGVGLKLLEQALPQAAQEGLETVIGWVAVCFVTTMIVWMNTHARGMKHQLEAETQQALSHTSSLALACMAFLAVLKEGFETSVFLLATFSAAQSALIAASGAIIGLLAAFLIGWGIYIGGVKINLSKFFRYTSAFLILVAAGLVISSLRTGHEAGWINAGQQVVLNLGWLVTPGTIQSALITGVLGIPTDPRFIEVLGWCIYVIPVSAYLFWPQAHRLSHKAANQLKQGLAIIVMLTAIGLAIFYPADKLQVPDHAPVVTTSTPTLIGQAKLISNTTPYHLQLTLDQATPKVMALANGKQQQRNGLNTTFWTLKHVNNPDNAPKTLTIEQVIRLSGGRIPIGLNPRQHPGPYQSKWAIQAITKIWAAKGTLLDARHHSITTVTLSGGGLNAPRTLTVGHTPFVKNTTGWHISPHYSKQITTAIHHHNSAQIEEQFWAMRLPIVFLLVALLLWISVWRSHRKTTE